MKLVPVLLLFVLGGAQASSWFGNDPPPYQSWDTQQLTAWLKAHDVALPSSAQPPTHKYLQELVKKHWSHAQDVASDSYDTAASYGRDVYENGQYVIQAGKEQTKSAFDKAVEGWDDSSLRGFLLEHGVVEPKGPREQLEKLAREKYREYMRKMGSASAYVAQATQDIGRKAQEERDWIYSSWDDSQFHAFLVDKGLLKSKQEVTRDEMVKVFQEYYHAAADPIYELWSDSYINEWLFNHNIPPFTRDPPPRASLLQRMKAYYYDVTQRVWNTWSDSDLHDWLVKHNIISSTAQIHRSKLERLVSDNYLSARDTIWSAWHETDMRKWLVEHGIVEKETANKMSREELEGKMHTAGDGTMKAQAGEYLVWPDARLRAFLREHGISEDALPTSRPGLLQETRIRWVQTQHATDALYHRVLHLLNEGKHIAEERLHQILAILSGSTERVQDKTEDVAEDVNEKTGYVADYAAEKRRKAEEAAAKVKKEL